ncbi:MAG: UDP-N-acetylglucosamine 2-epimerase (hydrolyzing) [Candidatus Omnitrophica bacterium]|nr:UDP-N-acetylglucosamine 2-epimerase (hydrolyzing) [Candidatus Omnitrophota bacterium]
MKKKKVCIITGSRAEWGLLYPLASQIKKDRRLDLKLVATAGHLMPESGLTYKEIEDDGFEIDAKIAMPLEEDREEAIAKTVGIGVTRLTDVLNILRPELLFLLGDRFETFTAAQAAFFLKVPIAHIHGGELTEGSMDDSLRHAITKISHLHFVSTDIYRKRVIQMGEEPKRVFNVGALGLDNIKRIKPLKKNELEKRIDFRLGKNNIMVTYNPSTQESRDKTVSEFKGLLDALALLKDAKVIFTKPNVDIYYDTIEKMIDMYIYNNRESAKSFSSMGRQLYLNTLFHMDVVAGNSSSGIIEAPSFGIPTINIGDRQRGRVRADTVIDVKEGRGSLKRAFRKALSSDFRKTCKEIINPYGDGSTSRKIVGIVRGLDNITSKKRFLDLDFELPVKNRRRGKRI